MCALVTTGLDPVVHAEDRIARLRQSGFIERGAAYSTKCARYMLPYVAEFQFRYNNRFNPDIFGAAISGC